jgi:hypothetical protein
MAKLRLFLTAWAVILGLGIAAAPAHAAKYYVDPKLGEVTQRAIVSSPKPVQLVFEFQTDGVRNEKATKFAKPVAVKVMSAMPYFASVTDAPIDGGGLLTVRFNNITEKGAAGKGFKVGLTFGLAGTSVVDNYDVTFQLSPSPGAPALTSSVHHALVTTLGKKSDPTYGTEYRKVQDAVEAMMRQSIDHGLNQLAANDAFPGKTQ